MTVVICIIGSGRESGKTSLIETLTQQLSERFNLWTVKHISTSFDTKEKDTWRHLRAGATNVTAITNNEIITIRKTVKDPLEAVIRDVPRSVNLLLIEGFKKSPYTKIVVANTVDDAKKVMSETSNVFAIYMPNISSSPMESIEEIPVVNLKTLSALIEKMVLGDLIKRLPGLNCKNCGFSTCEAFAAALSKGEITLDKCKTISAETVSLIVDGEHIFLSPFPRDFIKSTVLGMISSLKGTKRNKVKEVSLEIKK